MTSYHCQCGYSIPHSVPCTKDQEAAKPQGPVHRKVRSTQGTSLAALHLKVGSQEREERKQPQKADWVGLLPQTAQGLAWLSVKQVTIPHSQTSYSKLVITVDSIVRHYLNPAHLAILSTVGQAKPQARVLRTNTGFLG